MGNVDKLLVQDTRKVVFELVGREPGLHMREIARILEMNISLAEHHLNSLEKGGLVFSVKDSGYRRYFAVPSDILPGSKNLGQKERRAIGLLRQEIPARVVLYLLKHERASNTDLARGLEIPAPKLSYHLKKMLQVEILSKKTWGDGKGYTLVEPDRALRLLAMCKARLNMFDEFTQMVEDLDMGFDLGID